MDRFVKFGKYRDWVRVKDIESVSAEIDYSDYKPDCPLRWKITYSINGEPKVVDNLTESEMKEIVGQVTGETVVKSTFLVLNDINGNGTDFKTEVFGVMEDGSVKRLVRAGKGYEVPY